MRTWPAMCEWRTLWNRYWWTVVMSLRSRLHRSTLWNRYNNFKCYILMILLINATLCYILFYHHETFLIEGLISLRLVKASKYWVIFGKTSGLFLFQVQVFNLAFQIYPDMRLLIADIGIVRQLLYQDAYTEYVKHFIDA